MGPLWEYVLSGKAQLYFCGWIADYPSMDNFLYPAFESGSSPTTLGTFYSDPGVDATLAKARATTDQRARIQRYPKPSAWSSPTLPRSP